MREQPDNRDRFGLFFSAELSLEDLFLERFSSAGSLQSRLGELN